MTTDPITTGGTGSGWPDPTEPGVPAAALHDGFHWLAYQDGGPSTIGQWSPDAWTWIISQIPGRMSPEEVAHMNYIGQCSPPNRSR
jgi:hypothetical protein